MGWFEDTFGGVDDWLQENVWDPISDTGTEVWGTITGEDVITETYNEDEYEQGRDLGLGTSFTQDELDAAIDAQKRQESVLESLQIGAPGKSVGAEEDEEEKGRRTVKKARLGTKALQIGTAPTINIETGQSGGNI